MIVEHNIERNFEQSLSDIPPGAATVSLDFPLIPSRPYLSKQIMKKMRWLSSTTTSILFYGTFANRRSSGVLHLSNVILPFANLVTHPAHPKHCKHPSPLNTLLSRHWKWPLLLNSEQVENWFLFHLWTDLLDFSRLRLEAEGLRAGSVILGRGAYGTVVLGR